MSRTPRYNAGRFFLIALILGLFFLSCEEENNTISPGTGPFSFGIAWPGNGSSVNKVVHIQTDVSGAKEVVKVDFYIDGEYRETDWFFPYTYDWSTADYPEASIHTVRADVYEYGGYLAGVDSISVKVDNSPPSRIESIGVVDSTFYSITVDWIAPGTDGDTGQATAYEIAYSTSEITEFRFSRVEHVANPPIPSPPGSRETLTIDNLNPGNDYYVAIKTADEVYNLAELSINGVGRTKNLMDPAVDHAVLDYSSDIRQASLADFNRDGNIDIAVSEYNWGVVELMYGDGAGSFYNSQTVNAGPGVVGVLATDLTNDSFSDLVIANYYTNQIIVLINNRFNSFGAPKYITTSRGPMAIAADDINLDGTIDLLVACRSGSRVDVFHGDGTGAFSPTDGIVPVDAPGTVMTIDLNGDNAPDVVTPSFYRNFLAVRLNKGDGTFENPVNYNTGIKPLRVNQADFNEDGVTDIIVTNYNSNDISIYFGNGDGTIDGPHTIKVGRGPSSIDFGDYNLDGHLDLVIANDADNAVVRMLGYGDGTFRIPTSKSISTAPTTVLSNDIDKDGDLDLIVISEQLNYISTLSNNIIK